MKPQIGALSVLLLASLGPAALLAHAEDVDSIFVRGKFGLVSYANLDPVTSAVGLGLDLGFRHACGFGLGGLARMNLSASEYQSTTAVQTRTEAKTFLLGVVPNFFVTKGIATLSFGLGLGVLTSTTQTHVTTGTTTEDSGEISRSKFALIPDLEVDIAITGGLFGNAGVQYVTTLGDAPNPGIITPMAGFGYRF